MQRVPARVARDYLRQAFVLPPLVLLPESYERLVELAAEEGVTGGAVYDAIVAATAREAGATLLTLDRRAIATYERVGADYRFAR